MEIKRGNTVVCDVYLKDNSYTVEEIMGEDTLILNFLSRNVVELQINDYIDFEGTKYKVRHNEKVTKRETSLGWEYTVQFYSSRYDLLDVRPDNKYRQEGVFKQRPCLGTGRRNGFYRTGSVRC